MPKISGLNYVTQLEADGYMLGIQGGEAVRFPVSLFDGSGVAVTGTFLGNDDTPDSYTGQAGKLVAVNTAEDGLEFSDPPAQDFLGLTDTPDAYTGQGSKLVAVTSGAAGLEFVDAPDEIVQGSTAPASPGDGTLWLDTGSVGAEIPNYIDLSSAASDYLLKRGETAIVQFTNATSVALHVQTVEGMYELFAVNKGHSDITACDLQLLANNTTYANAITRADMQVDHSFSASGGVSISGFNYPMDRFYIWSLGTAAFFRISVSTFTWGKGLSAQVTAMSSTNHLNAAMAAIWNDVSTAWTSLGTVQWPYAKSGTFVIRRLY